MQSIEQRMRQPTAQASDPQACERGPSSCSCVLLDPSPTASMGTLRTHLIIVTTVPKWIPPPDVGILLSRMPRQKRREVLLLLHYWKAPAE